MRAPGAATLLLAVLLGASASDAAPPPSRVLGYAAVGGVEGKSNGEPFCTSGLALSVVPTSRGTYDLLFTTEDLQAGGGCSDLNPLPTLSNFETSLLTRDGGPWELYGSPEEGLEGVPDLCWESALNLYWKDACWENVLNAHVRLGPIGTEIVTFGVGTWETAFAFVVEAYWEDEEGNLLDHRVEYSGTLDVVPYGVPTSR